MDQYRIDGICSPVFIQSSRLSFETAVKVYLQPKDVQSLADDSAFIHVSGLLGSITDLFSNAFKICELSVWIKAANETTEPDVNVTKTNKARNENSFLVFNMILAAGNPTLTYLKALTYFEFLRTNKVNDENRLSKWNFYFADHIVFDKRANKAIDLADGVELVNRNDLNRLILSRIYCKVFMRMTEMRLCNRVKLDSEEYDIVGKALYLKTTGVSLYGNEYFVNRNNNTFVCIDRLNAETEETENDRRVNDESGEIQQEERKAPLITKDFAFFIGCLALVALFVTVALAKKKYLLSKTTNTVIVG